MDYLDEELPIELPLADSSIIKVIGIGGGGGNAVSHMYKQGITDVSFVVCNTDDQALQKSPVPMKILLGDGLGAGGRPERGREAAEESVERVQKLLGGNTKMAFITAGMGGGTGTGASPVVAKALQEMGVLTVGIVTIPFAFERRPKQQRALEGVAALSEHVDAILVINNEKLWEIYPDLNLSNAFAKADDVLTNAARGIAEIITVPGYINTDFADVYNIMKDGKVAIMNTGSASGEHRVTRAIEDALNSPLLNTSDVSGASKVLLQLYCSHDSEVSMEEVRELNDFMDKVGEDVDVIWGATYDESLGESVKITLIATGFEVSDIPGMPARPAKPEVQDEPVDLAELWGQPAAGAPSIDIDAMADVPFEVNGEPIVTEDDIRDRREQEKKKRMDEAINRLYGRSAKSVTQADKPQTSPEEEVPLISLDDLDDDAILGNLENVPAWKRYLKK